MQFAQVRLALKLLAEWCTDRCWGCGKLRVAVKAMIQTVFELSDALAKCLVFPLQRVLARWHRVFAHVSRPSRVARCHDEHQQNCDSNHCAHRGDDRSDFVVAAPAKPGRLVRAVLTKMSVR